MIMIGGFRKDFITNGGGIEEWLLNIIQAGQED